MNSNMNPIMSTSAFRFFDSISIFFSRCVTCTIALMLSTTALAASETAAVGEVSLVLGKAYLLRTAQARQLVEVGTEIRVSDQIVTEANGHVHIRFIDNALQSVRPDSQLEIERYDFDPAQPKQSSIKLNLVDGVTRAISGEGAKAARSRFRLNTPIAAIGVRGTDFVVSATQSTTRALVNQGAIILAPYSADCTAAAFGPCASNAVELTDNSLQIIEIDGTTPVPRLIPAPHEREPGAMRQEVQLAVNQAQSSSDDSAAGKDIYRENVTSKQAVDVVASSSVMAEPEPVIPEFTPDAPAAIADLAARQLVWGRWADGRGGQERITLDLEFARVGRKATVGNVAYLLYRSESFTPQIDPGLGPVSFSLNSAQAFYNSDSGVVAMQVNGGSLDIDFDQSRFSTELNLNHVDTGLVDFIATGSITERGYFNARSPSQHIAGAVSQDGTEAGYFFQQQLESGSIDGLTLWDSQ